MAVSGNRNKMDFTSTTSIRMIASDEITTLLVAARRTPSAPSLVV
jgi:hypothetical protein